MTDIVLNPVASGYNVAIINDNFTSIQDNINNDVAHLTGGNNIYQQDLDLNSNDLLNVNMASVQGLTINGQPVTISNLGGLGPNSVGSSQIIDGSVTMSEIDPAYTTSVTSFVQAGTGSKTRTMQDKAREKWSVADKLVVGDRVTDNISAINNVFMDAPPLTDVYIPVGDYVVSSRPINNYGKRLVGPGSILLADGYGGYDKLNTYRNTRPIATGKEYLWAVYNVIQATNREIRCYLYGDSTVEGGFNFIDWGFFLQSYLPDAVSNKGVRNYFSVTNNGVGGSNLSTWNPTPDIGVNSATPADLVILKCGINDASFPLDTRLDTFRDNLRAGLAAIRAVDGGDVGGTAILLVGPNATVDRQDHHRDAEWYEQLRGIFEAAAADYQCAYFDTYAYLQDAARNNWAMARWINDDTAVGDNPVGLHPRNVGQSWIWGAIVDWMFGSTEILRWKTNTFQNKSVYFGHNYAKQIPDYYPINYDPGITVEVTRTAEGWPFAGILTTTKSAEGPALQELRSLDSSDVKFTRTSDPGNFWGAWRGWFQVLSYSNGWANFGGPYGVGKAMVNEEQEVHLSGLIKPGTTTIGTKIFTLPAEMRPVNQKIVAAISDTGICVLEVLASGDVQLKSGTPSSYLSLSGVFFAKG